MQLMPANHPMSNKMLSKLDTNMKLIISEGFGSFDVIINAEDIKNSLEKKPTEYGMVKTIVKMFNLPLPVEIEPGITYVDTQLKGKSLTYYYSIDESSIDMAQMEYAKEEFQKSQHDQIFQNQDDEFIKLCLSCLHDMKFIYKGNKSGKTLETSVLLNAKN